MWRLGGVLVLACLGCGAEPASPTTPLVGVEPAPASNIGAPASASPAAAPATGTPPPMPEPEPDCHHACCSAEMVEMQRKAAGGDPSIEYECCMCTD